LAACVSCASQPEPTFAYCEDVAQSAWSVVVGQMYAV
jgi:hypothetical protein